jgi:hypothetical protein
VTILKIDDPLEIRRDGVPTLSWREAPPPA